MFCPNCGKDCGEFKFCPECGTQLEAIRNGVTVGKKELKFPPPPIGKYKSADGEWVEITRDAISFYKKKYFGLIYSSTKTEAIPFTEIYRVSIVPPKGIKAGILCVRGGMNKYQALATEMTVARDDSTSVYFNSPRYNTFWRIYLFLKQCADIVNETEN